jgi:hypothetical protein
MIAAISFLLSYALQGLAEVTDGLTAETLKKPLWAFQPTSGKMFLAGATWPMAAIANAYVGNPSEESRAVAFALLGIAMRLAPLAAMIWGSIRLAQYSTNNVYLEVAVVVGFLAVLRFVMPVVTLLLMPLSFVLAATVDLLFRKKTGR